MRIRHLKVRNKIKERSGFTLLEMILVVALISVLFTMVSFLIPFWYKAYIKTVNVNYARQISNSVMGAVEEQIRFANKVEIIDDASVQRLTGKGSFGVFYIPMKESTNLIDGLVYDEKFFISNDISLKFSLGPDNEYCTITVTVLHEEEKVLEKTRTVMLSGENG